MVFVYNGLKQRLIQFGKNEVIKLYRNIVKFHKFFKDHARCFQKRKPPVNVIHTKFSSHARNKKENTSRKMKKRECYGKERRLTSYRITVFVYICVRGQYRL